jgi:hypothetical protein
LAEFGDEILLSDVSVLCPKFACLCSNICLRGGWHDGTCKGCVLAIHLLQLVVVTMIIFVPLPATAMHREQFAAKALPDRIQPFVFK